MPAPRRPHDGPAVAPGSVVSGVIPRNSWISTHVGLDHGAETDPAFGAAFVVDQFDPGEGVARDASCLCDERERLCGTGGAHWIGPVRLARGAAHRRSPEDEPNADPGRRAGRTGSSTAASVEVRAPRSAQA